MCGERGIDAATCPVCGSSFVEVEPDDVLYGAMGDVPYETSSGTSAAAAQSIDEDDLSRLEAWVYEVIAKQPQTCDSVEATTGLAHQTVSARIRGLVLRDQVIDSGLRARTRHGRKAVVWRVKTAADRAAEEAAATPLLQGTKI
jgi:hypothetical protein